VTKDWPRPVVHFEIVARDPERLRSFYSELFNWDISEGGIMNFDAGLGGPEPGPGGHLGRGDAGGVVLYIQVRDLAESLERTKRLGGEVTAEPFQFPDTPTLAGITDPEGNHVVLVQQ